MSNSARFALLLCLLLAAPLAQAASEWLDYRINGQERRVLLHAPERLSETPPPLVVVYHGRGDDAAAFAAAVKLHDDWPEAVIAYPRGEPHEARPQRGWQYRAGQYADRDLLLTDALLADLGERFGIPPERRFAAGFSNGGHFIFLLREQRPDAFAAHAVLGAVRPDHVGSVPPRPLLYLFGRGEDRRHQEAWRKTVEALVKDQRTVGPLRNVLGCCALQQPAEGGARLVFGLYNAGHIWPAEGNRWLRAFFEDELGGAAEAQAPP